MHNFALPRHRVVLYDMGDDIHDNRNDKNIGEKFKVAGDLDKIAIEYLKYAKRSNKDGDDNYTTEAVAKPMLLEGDTTRSHSRHDVAKAQHHPLPH